MSSAGGPLARAGEALTTTLGGRRRRRIVVLLACVLALDAADLAAIGSVAGQLERALGISNTAIGLLVSIPSLVAAVATLPTGVLADRVRRVRLLAVSVMLWSVAMLASALVSTFVPLLLTRIALGAATAAAGPVIASLIGDYFMPAERARIYGYILTGELIGAGFGFLISGEAAALGSWRAAFVVLALPSALVGFGVWRLLEEPGRGGGGTLELDEGRGGPAPEAGSEAGSDQGTVRAEVQEQDVSHRERLVLSRDPIGMTLWQACRYVLSIPSNAILIVASALGYFYFSGTQTFAVVYFEKWFDLSHAMATLGLTLMGGVSVVGVLIGGRLADRLVSGGRLDGRIVVGGWSAVLATVVFVPAILSGSLVIAIPFFLVAGALLAARNPPLDAARLDVMHPGLWGRAEAVRTLTRRVAVAFAPLAFGAFADLVNGSTSSGTGQTGFGSGATPQGLHYALLTMLVTLGASGLLTLRARRFYARDVATVAASERRIARAMKGENAGG